MATPKKLYSVDPKFIRDAHKAACSDWKKKIETKFPEVFKPKTPSAFIFKEGFELDGCFRGGPLCIGYSLAPSGLDGKCLVVEKGYKMEVKNKNGYQILVFRKK